MAAPAPEATQIFGSQTARKNISFFISTFGGFGDWGDHVTPTARNLRNRKTDDANLKAHPQELGTHRIAYTARSSYHNL